MNKSGIHFGQFIIKYRKTRWILISVFSALILFFIFFKIERTLYFASCVAKIRLELNHVVKDHKVIYPTELLSVNPTKKTASIRVEFPDEGWQQFDSRENMQFENIGYYIETIGGDYINISVPYSENGYHYYVRYRWQ